MQLAELDWMVCNGGADIWHLLPARGDKEATWAADEQWDAHISFRRARGSLKGPSDPLACAMTKLLLSNSRRLHGERAHTALHWIQGFPRVEDGNYHAVGAGGTATRSRAR